MKHKHGIQVLSGLFSLLLAFSSSARADELLLKPNDRLVFLGDSLTAAHTYMRLVEVFIRLRYPQLPITFINAGVSGNTAKDGLDRLERDVLSQQPSVVLINFGLNDSTFSPSVAGGDFEGNMKTMLNRLARQPGVRLVIWMDTTPFYIDGLPARHPTRDFDQRVEQLVEFIHQEGKNRELTVVPWHAAMKELFDRAGAAKAKLLPDRIHPAPAGYAVMALELLKSLHSDVSPTEIAGSFQRDTLSLQNPGLFSKHYPWDAQVPLRVDLRGIRAPVLFSRIFPKGLPIPPALAALGRLTLKIQNLPPGTYRIDNNGSSLGSFGHTQLAQGIDLLARVPPEPAISSLTGHEQMQKERRNYSPAEGALFLDAYYQLWDVLQAKDRLRLMLRPEAIKLLPALFPDYQERYRQLVSDWLKEVEAKLNEIGSSLLDEPKELFIVPLR